MELASLPRSAVVVRGGSNRDGKALAASVRETQSRKGKPVVSVYIVPLEAAGGSWAAAVALACEEGPVPHGKIQTSTVGGLLDAGFLIADERAPDESVHHYHVYFSESVADSEGEAWMAAFSEPTPKPAKEEGATT